MHKKILVSFLLGAAFVIPTVLAQAGFPDVRPGDWFHGYVMQIRDWGVVGGNDDGTFAPSRNINRAEFSKMLVMYDQRVDEKIERAVSGIDTSGSSSSSSSSSGNLPSVMYLEKFNAEPARCPGGWSEAGYGKNWEHNGQNSYIRTCYTASACQVMYLDQFNAELNDCPSGWAQADHGKRWIDGGQSKFRRTCYVCQ